MGFRTEAIHLTNAQWTEVYYAVQDKRVRVERGDYGPEEQVGADAAWAGDLLAIETMIGPDGVEAAQRGVAADVVEARS